MPTSLTATESILASIKKLLGIEDSYQAFDTDVIFGINSALMALHQIGVGPEDGLSITDRETAWSALLTNTKKIESAKSYIHLKVKLLFDPPTSSAVIEAMKEEIKESAWRLMVQTEIPIVDPVVEEEVVLGDFAEG